MLSEKGKSVLSDIYSQFSNRFVELFPGCNQNEIERSFLISVYHGLHDGDYLPLDLQKKIEEIR